MVEQLQKYDRDEEGYQDDITPKLSSVPTGGREGDTHLAKGRLHSVPTPEQLDGSETSAGSTPSGGDSLAERNGLKVIKGGKDTASDSDKSIPFRKEEESPKKGRLRKLMGARSKLKKKLMMGLAVGGGLGVVGVIWASVFIFGALLIPNLAAHITEYQAARVTREWADSQDRVTEEALAEESIPQTAGDGFFNSIKAKWSAAGTKTAELWSTFDKYRPSKVIQNLADNKGLAFNYESSITGRQVLKSVALDGTTYALKQQTNYTKFIPFLSDIIDFKNQVAFAQEFAPALNTALRTTEAGPIVRSAAAKSFREEADIGLVAWVVGKYKALNQEKAGLQQARDEANAIDKPIDPDNPSSDLIGKTDSAVQSEEKTVLSSDTDLQNAENNDGVSALIQKTATKSLAQSGLQSVLGFFNKAYAIAMPACIIYDGSLNQAGSTINNQVRQQEAAYYYLASAADQEKAGDVQPQAIGALTNNLNYADSYDTSIPELRSAGYTASSTGAPSAEASADGQYTLLNATPGLSGIAPFLNALANTACPTLTNIYAASGVALANILVTILSGGTDAAAEGAAASSTEVGSQIAENVASDVIKDEATNGVVPAVTKTGIITRRLFKLLADTVTSTSKIVAMTLLAKVIVLSRSGQINSGLAEGADLANEGDAGANAAFGDIDRGLNYGRPLTSGEVEQTNNADKQFIVGENQQRSAYQRYFALSNPDSLLSTVGTDIYTHTNVAFFSSIFSSIGRYLNPLTLIGKAFGAIDTRLTFAQSTVDDTTYGNVQFGWSQDEENLISSSPSYQPIENQATLDQAAPINGQDAEDAISSIYNQCFTDDIGTLLSTGLITRDTNGNVINTSNPKDCSPQNLGPNNPLYGDLVFRWRLAMSYNNTLSQLTQEQGLSAPT